MKKLTRADIKPLPEYEPIRQESRKRIVDLKRHRRLSAGDTITLVFENRDTLIHQIQEMMRTEHIYDEDKIQEEIDTYNALIPEPGELSATFFIEITEKERVKEVLDRLQGIDNGQAVYIQLGEERIDAVFEAGHSKEDKLSAVHYVRFRFSPGQLKAFEDNSVQAKIVVDHPSYHAETVVPDQVRSSLLKDLTVNDV